MLLRLVQLATLLKSPEFAATGQKPILKSAPAALNEVGDESTGDSFSDLRDNFSDEESVLENRRQNPRPENPLELWLTVHSVLHSKTVPQTVTTNRNGTYLGKKGCAGPASPPISLMPNLVLVSAGSLETAVEIFGKKLCNQLGLVCYSEYCCFNEISAKHINICSIACYFYNQTSMWANHSRCVPIN